MISRVWTNVLMLVSLVVLAGVAWYFAREYRVVRDRRVAVAELDRVAEQDGPCAGLEHAHAIVRTGDLDLERAVAVRRRAYATTIIGGEDLQAQAALLSADADGMVGRTLCEQIALVRAAGETHPVLELLRFTREGGDPCQDPQGLSAALATLTSHRAEMVHALMQQVGQLHCVPPWLATGVADITLTELQAQPALLDDLEVLRVAKFLTTWSPVQAAQLSCTVEVDGRPSRLATAIGCTPYHKRHVLPLYRATAGLPASEDYPALPAGAAVYLLGQTEDRCQVRPVAEPPRLALVGCRELALLSDVHVAVLVEQVEFGLARASLVAGLVTFDGATGRITPTVKEPELQSWYGYNRQGEPVGMTHTVRLRDLAAKYGEDVPDNPLRAFCHKSGARYCYDVDWAQVVGVLKNDPLVYLSRPMRIFLTAAEPDAASAAVIARALGRPPRADAATRLYPLPGDGFLVEESAPGGLELRWRLAATGPFVGQVFGAAEKQPVPPTARLLGVLDLEQDGRPELVLQRVTRQLRDGAPADALDEILLLTLDPAGRTYRAVTRLTVHEY